MFCCTSRYIQNTFSKCLKHEKIVFTYINILLSDVFLIKTLLPRLSKLDTRCGKKKRNVRFWVSFIGMAVCGRLLVVSVHLLVVCSRLLMVCGGFRSFVGDLWLFVVVACFSNYNNDGLTDINLCKNSKKISFFKVMKRLILRKSEVDNSCDLNYMCFIHSFITFKIKNLSKNFTIY